MPRSRAFSGGQLPFPSSFNQMSDRLLRRIELVDIDVPGGTITRDRTQFTPVQEAQYQSSQRIKQGDWHGAIEALQRIIELKPEPLLLSGAYTMIGMAHLRLRNYDAAIDAFREAIETYEDIEFAHLFLGVALMLSERYEEAIDPLKKSLELDPTLSHVNFYPGYLYEKFGWWEKAKEAYSTEIATHPESPEAYLELARILVKLGRRNSAGREQYYLQAIEIYRKLLEIQGENSETYSAIGYLYAMLSQHDQASEAYQRAVAVKPHNVIALNNLGTAYLMTGRHQEAKNIFEQLTQLSEDVYREQLAPVSSKLDEDVRLNLADAYQKLGAASINIVQQQSEPEERNQALLAEAETALKKSLEYSPGDIHTLNNLGVTYYRMGRTAAAIRQFNQALEIDPNDRETVANLRIAEEEMEKIRNWLRSVVWQRLQGASEQSPVYSDEFSNAVAEAYERIYERAPDADRDDVFTRDDFFQTMLPVLEQVESSDFRLDAASRFFQRKWVGLEQGANLGNTDVTSFLAYLYILGVPIFEGIERNIPDDQEQADQFISATIEVLNKVLELQPDNDQAQDLLRRLMERRLDEKLRASGLLKEIKGPVTDLAPYQNRTLLPVGDKPLSEIVIEGRR